LLHELINMISEKVLILFTFRPINEWFAIRIKYVF
jgi:hypothetical protein